MQIQDVYKLVHQAALGSEHSNLDPSAARKWLASELKEMGTGIEEHLMDSISPDGEIVRVHLRPYFSVHGDIEALLDAFIRTGHDFHGAIETLEAYWDCVIQAELFSASILDDFIRKMKNRSYPAAHHSEQFRQLYHPAYRVVWRKYFPYPNL